MTRGSRRDGDEPIAADMNLLAGYATLGLLPANPDDALSVISYARDEISGKRRRPKLKLQRATVKNVLRELGVLPQGDALAALTIMADVIEKVAKPYLKPREA